jgi:hypothetical protein
MRIVSRFLPIIGAALLCATLIPIARASESDKKTIVTFAAPVAIPGHVLPAGTYVFTVFDSPGDHNTVQVWNQNQSELLAMTETVPTYLLLAPDTPIFRLDDRFPDSPSVIRAWFYPGDTSGHEFVYSLDQATVPAAAYEGSR